MNLDVLLEHKYSIRQIELVLYFRKNNLKNMFRLRYMNADFRPLVTTAFGMAEILEICLYVICTILKVYRLFNISVIIYYISIYYRPILYRI